MTRLAAALARLRERPIAILDGGEDPDSGVVGTVPAPRRSDRPRADPSTIDRGLAAIVAAYPGATVELRPRTPAPDPPGHRVWYRPLAPKPGRRSGIVHSRPALVTAASDPNGCHCGQHCDPRILTNGRLPDGRWEHLECALKQGDER